MAVAVAGCAAAALGAAPAAVAAPGGADVAATISGPSGTVPLGSSVTYTITVINNGPEVAPGTVGFISVDGRARVDSATASAGTCGPGKGKIKGFSCSFGTLGVGGDAVTVTVHATVPRKAGTVIASVQVASEAPGLDPDGANNVAETTTTVG